MAIRYDFPCVIRKSSLRFAFETMDNVNSEQRLEAANLILKATEIRLDFLSDVTAMDEALKNVKTMKEQIARLQKEAAKPAPYEIVVSEEPASGKAGKKVRRSVKKSN